MICFRSHSCGRDGGRNVDILMPVFFQFGNLNPGPKVKSMVELRGGSKVPENSKKIMCAHTNIYGGGGSCPQFLKDFQ